MIAPGVLDGAAAELAARLPGRVERDAPSAPLTTYRCGGRLGVLVRAGDDAALTAVADVRRVHGLPVLVVGRGSNLLVADAGFRGVAVLLDGRFEEVHLAEGGAVAAGGAVALPVLARRCAAAGLGGLEFYVGIPGSVGGAVRMNAGGHGRETRDVLRDARVFDLTTASARTVACRDLRFGYRSSALGPADVVVGATFAAVPDDPAACTARIDEVVRWRREHQPGGANAGSVFANPPGDAAGRLIDVTGCKGLRVGGAAVSEKHANFVVAGPSATAADVRAVVEQVRRRVADATGVLLQTELCMVGFDDDVQGSAP